MPTKNQLIRHGREEKRRTNRTRASDQCPQKQGVCPRVSTRTPKKPNSALRTFYGLNKRGQSERFARCEIPLYSRSQGFAGNSGSKKRQIKIWYRKTQIQIDMNGRCLWNLFSQSVEEREGLACVRNQGLLNAGSLRTSDPSVGSRPESTAEVLSTCQSFLPIGSATFGLF
ncbi:Ribosomal protein S12, bacteria [Corchorus olitorius]|uniref:Ribosomal protein S12, bacteria n=1 Tax=Corchorus olitorius TaxID=93759 RepID=A0A1R3KVS4_9ROSI|nr:Ribosomal protein S12, bacteria [Corchorus olitorius]